MPAVHAPAAAPKSFVATSSRQPHIARARNASPAITTRLELNTRWRLSSWRKRKRCSADGAIVQTAASAAKTRVTKYTARSNCPHVLEADVEGHDQQKREQDLDAGDDHPQLAGHLLQVAVEALQGRLVTTLVDHSTRVGDGHQTLALLS